VEVHSWRSWLCTGHPASPRSGTRRSFAGSGTEVPLESLSELPFDGLLFHAAGDSENRFCVMDVFESEAAVRRFRDAVTTIAEEVGIEELPEFFPAHTFVLG
jgi:hypothetical protein